MELFAKGFSNRRRSVFQSVEDAVGKIDLNQPVDFDFFAADRRRHKAAMNDTTSPPGF